MKTTLRNMILGLVLFLILLIIIGNNLVRVIYESTSDCKGMIVARTKNPKLFSNDDIFMDKCISDFIQIKPKYTKWNNYLETVRIGSEYKNYYKPDNIENVTYNIFSNALYKCWTLSLDGKAYLGKSKGLLCARITFDDSLKAKSLKFYHLFDYVKTTPVDEDKMAYSHYLLNKFSMCGYSDKFKLDSVKLKLNKLNENEFIPVFINEVDDCTFESYDDKRPFEIDTSKNYFILFLSVNDITDKCNYPLRSVLFLLDDKSFYDLLKCSGLGKVKILN